MPITQKQANDIYEIIKTYNEMFAKCLRNITTIINIE